jgi:hypothetical protein
VPIAAAAAAAEVEATAEDQRAASPAMPAPVKLGIRVTGCG